MQFERRTEASAHGRASSDPTPEGRRKAVPTARRERGGKVTTASQRAGQRDLFLETADSPQGAVPGARTGQPVPRVRYAVPKSRNIPGETLPAMTMEEVASDDNLIRAFAQVAQTAGRLVRMDRASTRCARISANCSPCFVVTCSTEPIARA